MEDRDLEIVGLHASTNGRSCCIHSSCGDHVMVGDLLRLVKRLVSINGGEVEEGIKCVRVMHGTDTCTIGFVPRSVANSEKIKAELGCFMQVIELYDDSKSPYKKKKSVLNKGMAACALLSSIPQAE